MTLVPLSIIEVGKKGCRERRMCITEATEAYGLRQYENCRSSSEAILKHQAEHPETVPPTYNKKIPKTHAFKAKWSDDVQGNCSGWGTEAYEAFDEWLGKIHLWRTEEVMTEYKRWAVAQAACKEPHEEDGDDKKGLAEEDDESEHSDGSVDSE